ncbi:hypothetical protein [Neptuniibacter sp. CAU 1671]|uniref:HvfA family oxazolone/thioamide-modified RiPP metallophore n=1 Tax=Neptuniibacter sp. CAU 1671 TaxID=3032593 RepID=UPI0031F38A61
MKEGTKKMAKMTHVKPVVAAIGAAFIAGMAMTPVANAAENPFATSELSSGYQQLAEAKCGESKKAEGSCGEKKAEGSCGEKKAEGSCGEKKAEASCGEKKAEAKCGESKKAEEGKCGEAKCGEKK